MKPLSVKTLQNMYIKARITKEENIILHRYLSCFSYLYGCIQTKELWDVFKQYEEKITKEKFYDFIDIAQREENDFYIFNLNEAYTGETSKDTEDKLIVNNFLVMKYANKFWYLHRLEEFKDYRHGPYVPSKDELFKFNHDILFETEAGKEMKTFISNLKTSGIETNKYNHFKLELLDLNGNSVKGELLKDVVCFNHWENFEIGYCKRESEKEYLIKTNSITCSEKILNKIKRYLMIENPSEVNDAIQSILDYICYDFGVELSQDEATKFIELYMNMSNGSNRWSIFGHSPSELFQNRPKTKGPIQLQFGPNIQKAIDNGEYDLKELEKLVKENNMNIRLVKQEKEEETYEDIINENNEYLKDFSIFLKKRNYRESVIEEHLNRVEYYINDYLIWGIPKHMEKGCSLEVLGFIENKVNEKVMPPSVYNIDFFLASIKLFYECMCEKKRISREKLNDFKNDIKNMKDELIEDYYSKNPKEIDLYEVIQAIEEAHGYGKGYINIKTAEKVFIPEDETLYDGDIDELYNKIDGLYWVKVPDINDYKIMSEFVLLIKNKTQSDKLYDILHNKKAYRNFKDAIYKMNIEDKYYDFYDSKIEELAKRWLEENNQNVDYD